MIFKPTFEPPHCESSCSSFSGDIHEQVYESMLADGYYDNHNKTECLHEFARREKALLQQESGH